MTSNTNLDVAYDITIMIDDKEYELYDENNEKIGNITGTELEKFVLDRKKEIDSLYSK